jgi:serine protease Do
MNEFEKEEFSNEEKEEIKSEELAEDIKTIEEEIKSRLIEEKPKKKRSILFSIIVIFVIGALIGGFLGGYISLKYFKSSLNLPSIQNPTNVQYINISDVIKVEESQIVNVAEKVSPAVVRISTTQVVQDFFFTYETPGLGSGFIISSDGYIVTNNHVIEGAKKITVTLSDGKEYDGFLVGTDPSSDVALLRINATDLPYLTFTDSSMLRVGQTVIAIGNPYGFDHTVTTGVISALERTLTFEDGTTLVGVIQTDAAINPGNSGGPLLNLSGEVVGMNTAIYAAGQGIGFAVSSNTIMKVINDLKLYGKVRWPFLGISGVAITDDIAKRNDLPVNKGILVVQVLSGTSASDAGLKPFDIITKFDGKDVTSVQELTKYLRQKNIGDKVKLEIIRNGKKIEIEVTLKERPTNLSYLKGSGTLI